ncbi:MAG: hypothetical protein KBT18_12895, partial [Comamonas sp.]|nr:hypothetical protein [Candidatus Comamonas equi]
MCQAYPHLTQSGTGKPCAWLAACRETERLCRVNDWERLQVAVGQAPVCVVEVLATQGSAPRGRGAWMAVQPQGLIGTIGGGHLEWGPPAWRGSGYRKGWPVSHAR